MRAEVIFRPKIYVYIYFFLLNRVAPLVTDPPPNSFTTLSKRKEIWPLTCDIWHMAYGIWHVIYDRWREVNLLSKFQLPSSYGFGMKVFWRYFHKGWMSQLINHLQRCLWNSPGYTGSLKYIYIKGPHIV